MAMHGKKYRNAQQKAAQKPLYPLDEAIQLVKDVKYTKFDESLDLAINLGVDPKQSDQMVRGAVTLPHGTGKKVRVLVFAKGEKEMEAKNAGADYVGAEDLIEKIGKGWMDFDAVVAPPDMMGQVSKLGKVLGPRGLMPNPKVGTVTFDLAKAIKELKQGKVEFKTEKSGIVHVLVGKSSFASEELKKNILEIVEAISKRKPAASKGVYLKKITLSSTMGPAIPVDVASCQVATT